jgi:hypothetical protein
MNLENMDILGYELMPKDVCIHDIFCKNVENLLWIWKYKYDSACLCYGDMTYL